MNIFKLFAVVLLSITAMVPRAGGDTAAAIDDPTREAAGKNHKVVKPAYPVTLFYSSGDAIVEYKWMPMDSEATCRAGFEILRRSYNCDRILWREADNDWFAKYDKIRQDSPWLGDLMTDALRINREYRNSEHACKAAKANGIQFWGIAALYDYCGKAECGAGGSMGTGAFWGIDPWLEKHPEYRMQDRAGITHMTGIIEYGDKVREEYVRRTEEMFNGPWGKYEGMFMYSFVENMEAHYTDEYIYSDYAVKDFKKRYGVDVRTQNFDLDKYYAMRGEYITQFLRELRPVYKKYRKKLAIALNSENMEWPMLWLCGSGCWPKNAAEPFILQQGKVKMDWRTWLKEGLVDELHVWGGTGPDKKLKDVKELLAAAEGTGVKVTVYFSTELPEKEQYLYEKGVRRVISPTSSEDGNPARKHPAADIDSEDYDAVLNVLTQARKKELELPAEKITGLLLKHPNPLVRRQAANTIGTLKLKAGVAALEEAAMNDPEGSVKAMVFDALGKVNGPGSVKAMAAGFGKVNTFPARMALRNALAAMGPERYADVAGSYDTDDSYYRTVLVQSWSRRNGTPEYLTVLKRAVKDPNDKVRWWAAFAFSYHPVTPENMEILYKALDDSSGAVQSRAAMTLKNMIPKMSAGMKQRVFDKLMDRYREFGAGCKRTDYDWGWRPIGETIRDGFSSQGKKALLAILNGTNTELAQLTWRVFFQPNDEWHPVSKDDMERRYRFYPGGADHGKCSLSDIYALSLPAQDNILLENNFDDKAIFFPALKGTAGTVSKGGRWDSFADKGVLLTAEQTHSGRQAIKVVRGGNPLTASFTKGGAGATFEASAWIYRVKSSFTMSVTDIYRKEVCIAGVFEDGQVCLYDFSSRSWIRSKIMAPSGVWFKLTIYGNLAEEKYTAGIKTDAEDGTRLDISTATNSDEALSGFGVYPGAPPDSVTYIDDVQIIQKGIGKK